MSRGKARLAASPAISRSPGDAAATPPETTMEQVFERLIRREDAQADAMVQMASRMGTFATSLENQQTQLDRLARLIEAQSEHNMRMVALAEKSAEHGRTFERFGNDIEKLKTQASRSTELHAHNGGSVRTLLWIVGTTLPIGTLIVAFAYNTLANAIAEVSARQTTDTAQATAAREKLRDQIYDLQRTRARP